MGCLRGSHILCGVADVDSPFDPIPLQDQGDVLPLAEAGPARRFMVVEETRQPMGVKEGLGIVLGTVADQGEEVAPVEPRQGLPHPGIKAGTPLKEIGRLRVEAAVGEGIAFGRRQVGKLNIADLPGGEPHEPVQLRRRDAPAQG